MKNRILHRFDSFTFRTQLLLVACLLALPAFVLVLHSGYVQSRDAIREGLEDARFLVYTITAEQHNLSGNIEQLLTVLAQHPAIKNHDVAETDKILADILRKSTAYGNIIVADINGDVWASGLPRSALFSMKGRRPFQNAVRTGQFSSGEYFLGRISRKSSIGYGYPIIDARGNVEGVIVANINFKQFDETLKMGGLPNGSSYTIIDHKGMIVDRYPDPRGLIGTTVNDEIFQGMKNGSVEESKIDVGLTGEKSIVSYRKLCLKHEQIPYLYIRASIPFQETQKKARHILLDKIIILLPILLAVFFVVMGIGNLVFVKRINKLQEATKRLAEGDLQVRVADVVEGGEIGSLGQSFDLMARNLAERESERRKVERELHELNVSLTKRVEEETDRRVQHERLLARNARLVAMGEMIGAIAHQWRQPLATLGATIQSIRMAWERNCLDKAFLEKAETDAQKQLYYMSDTIEDFRNFFRQEKIAERFDIGGKIDEVVLLVSSQFSNSGISLDVIDNSADCRLQIKGYQNEFKQSLLNIVSNAFDAVFDKVRRAGEHGEKVDFTGRVVISISCEGDTAVIEVQDNGCGIPDEYADKVFDPYFTTKSGEKGTGIGLYMTKLIIEESMGGRLSFISGPAGTIFKIELARDDSEQGDIDG